jgi:hypothetical protein
MDEHHDATSLDGWSPVFCSTLVTSFSGYSDRSAWPCRRGDNDLSKILELLIWLHGVTHKKAWIFSNTAVRTSNIAITLTSLLYCVVRRCRLVLGYNLHGITSQKSDDFNYAVVVDRNIARLLMFSLICNDRSLATWDVTSAVTHKIWDLVVVPKK